MIKHIVTRGFGNGTFAGEIARVVTRGYGVGEQNPVTLIGSWSNVIDCRSANQRIECYSANNRIET